MEARDRSQSDHTLILLNTGSSTHTIDLHSLNLRGGLLRDGFYDMVANVWQSTKKDPHPWRFGKIKLDLYPNIFKVGLNTLQDIIQKRRKG